MSKVEPLSSSYILKKAKVVKRLPNLMFRVKLIGEEDKKDTILAYTAGKIKKISTRVVVGDTVSILVAYTDNTMARLVKCDNIKYRRRLRKRR